MAGRFLRELAEPWGVLLAATSAGAAWAVQLPVAAAAGVGGVVLVTKASIAAWQGRGRGGDDGDLAGPRAPRVEAGSEEASWVRRAEDAADEFDGLSRSLSDGPLATEVSGMEAGVDETLETLRRLAGRASTTMQAMRRIDTGALAEERRDLQRRRKAAVGDVQTDVDRSLASIERQQAVYDRLSAARAKLLAQLTAGAHGLEELVARLVELSATSDAELELGGDTVAELTDRLEGIRRGVVEADEAARRSLGSL